MKKNMAAVSGRNKHGGRSGRSRKRIVTALLTAEDWRQLYK